MLVTSANAPTSLEYGASGDMVFFSCSFLFGGWEVFFVYMSVLTLLLVVVFNVVIGLCGCLFVRFFFMVDKGEVR